jgi:hypothetical protein
MPPTPSWTIEFYDVADGDDLGSVEFDGRTMTATSDMAGEMIEGADPEDVFERYRSWSNGYVSSRLKGEKRTMPQGGARIPTMDERKKAMANVLETTRYVDPQTGEEYDPVEVPADPFPDEGDQGGGPSPASGL